jgi:hypothetical protein
VNLRVFAGKPEDLNRSPSSFYLNFSRTGANARYLSAQGERGPVAMLAEPFTNRSARATTWVGLAVNRKSGEVALYLDGQLHRRGMLIGPLTVPDFGLSVPENDLTRLAPRAVLVSRVNDDLAVPAPPADQDAVRLANGDQLAGRLEAVSTNELVFHAAVGRVALPLERVAQITFAPSAPVTPRAVEAQVGLHDGTLLRGVWQRADAQSVVVQHAALGAVSFPRPALAEVDYRAETAGEVDWLAERLAARRMALRGGLFGLGLRRLYERTYRPGLIQLQPNAQWHGDLLAITNGVVRWQHPAALDPFVLPVAEVQRVSPLLRPVPVTPVAERATARLANGDVISGLLAGADGDAVRLTPWYAGPLAIPRRQVTQLTPHAPVAGALDLQPSTPGIVTDGAYWFGGRDCLQRRGALPDRLRLDLELVWSSQPGRAQVYLFSRGDPLELKDAPEYLNATFTPYGVHLRACVKDQAANTNFAAGLFTNLVAGGYVTLTVLADRPNRHLRLLVDGHQVGEWRGMDIAAPTGDGVMVFGDGWSGTAVRHVVLREWRDDPPPAPALRPVAPAPRSPADARVVLHNGDFLTLTDVTADSRQLTGRHKLLGPVNVALVAVRLLEWERPRPVNR